MVNKSVKHYLLARFQYRHYYLYTVKYVLLAIFIYIAYQFIFRLVIPVYRTTREVKKKFREMNSRMEEHLKQQQGFTNAPSPEKSAPKEKAGDYIDFEEVK